MILIREVGTYYILKPVSTRTSLIITIALEHLHFEISRHKILPEWNFSPCNGLI